MKTKEELNELKEEVESMNEKLKELTPEELQQIYGGAFGPNVAEVIGKAVASGVLYSFNGNQNN